jgi:hypothetical protein
MIEKVVWSVSTRPFEKPANRLNNKYEDFLYLFTASYFMNKRWFKKTELVTDDLGYEIITDRLGLKFDNVHLTLNQINSTFDTLFAYGKVLAYEIQQEPFMHIDYDVFWHKAPPDFILNAGIATQNAETLNKFVLGYPAWLQYIEKKRIKMPDYWDVWHTISYNCGLFAANDIQFVQLYSKEAKRVAGLIKHLHRAEVVPIDLMYEQFTLSLLAEKMNKHVTVLFDTLSDDLHEATLPHLNLFGYQHILGHYKNDAYYLDPIKQYVKTNHPEIAKKIQETLVYLNNKK